MHRVRVTAAFALILAWAVAPAAADDCPQWRGPKRDGAWRETGVNLDRQGVVRGELRCRRWS